jgi:hypothetical protein
VTNWDQHFQALSKGQPTAEFGATWSGEPYDIGFDVPEEAKTYGLPAGVGLAAGLATKLAGATGILSAIVALGAAGATYFAVQYLQPKNESKVLPPVQDAPAPRQQTSQSYVQPAPTHQQAPAVTAPAPGPTQPSSPWRILAPLSRDGAVLSVADVQNALNAAGLASPYLVVDGKAGNATTAAIKRAQVKFGLKQTGSTSDGDLKVHLQNAVNDLAANARANAASDALVADMKARGLT